MSGAGVLAVSALLVVLGFALSGCAAPASGGTVSVAQAPVPHPRARIVVVLPGPSTARFEQAKALTVALVSTLEPGDQITIVDSNFALVASEIAPGRRDDLAEVVACATISVGGPSQRCQSVALGRRELERWRAALVERIEQLEATAADQFPEGTCPDDSGWPQKNVLQLLLAFGGDQQNETLDVLVLGGGDAGARGNEPRLPARWLRNVTVVDAPYVMGCGGPHNLEDWFHDAAAVRVFSAERPASEFPAWLFGPSADAEAAR